MVAVLPIFAEEQPSVLYNTAVVVDADGTVLGKYRKNHISNLDKSWEKFYFRPGNLGYRCSRPRSADRGVHLLTTVTFLKARGSFHAASRAS